MNKQIQRLRFFDGEYVRAYDFTDEQTYHVEMRRRHNHRMHLHGIVYGLQIVQDEDSVPPLAVFYSVRQGMAIDQLGREVFVSAPYSLSTGDVLKQAGLQAGDYEVWLCYDERESDLPAAGYSDCNAGDQHTRWREAFRVQLRPVVSTSSDPECDGVCLGTVTLVNNNGWQITATTGNKRVYVGIRAQRVIPADDAADSFVITAENMPPPARTILPGYIDVLPGVRGRGNVVLEKNVVVGDDFPLDSTAHANLPKPNDIPAGGNVKITGDLFLKGSFFAYVDNEWYALKQYIQSLMPDVQASSIDIPIAPGASSATSDTATKLLTTTLPRYSGVPQVMVGLQTVDWQAGSLLSSHWSSVGDIQLELVALVQIKSDRTAELKVTWTIGPAVQVNASPAAKTLPIKNITVGYVVIFKP